MSKLSHELRSPLASIIGLTGVMRARLEAGQADAAVQVRQLDLIQASATRSLTTIDRVVDLARLTSGGVRPDPRLLDLRVVVAEVATELGESAAERGVRLRTDVPQHPVMVTSDPEMLGQLLRELASNALNFTDAGEVRIALNASDGPVVLAVSDDGPGIAADEQARIFEPFERGARAAEGDDGAPGLGLPLGRLRAALLGAQLSMRSQAGAGSTFTVTLVDLQAQPDAGPGAGPAS